MLELVGKPSLDLQQLSPAAVGRFTPSRSSFWNWVDGVDDDIEPEEEIGDSELMDHGVAFNANGEAGPLKRCLCRVHSQVAGPETPGESRGQRGLASARSSREDGQGGSHVGAQGRCRIHLPIQACASHAITRSGMV